MHCKVKILRHRGARRSMQEIAADNGTEGALTLAKVASSYELKLSAFDDQQGKPLVPILYDATLVTLQGDKMLFQGLERTGEAADAQYLQEWSVLALPRVIDTPPAFP